MPISPGSGLTPIDAIGTEIENVLRMWTVRPIIQTYLSGIDISIYNPNVDLVQAQQTGLDFVILSVGDDLGPTYNPYFQDKWQQAYDIGLLRGCYYFVRPELVSPSESITNLLQVVEPLLTDNDPVFCDVETGSGDLSQWVAEWGDLFKRNLGYKAGFYSAKWFMIPHRLNIEGVATQFSTLWLNETNNHWPDPPDGWQEVKLWQYQIGTVKGIEGQVDMDCFKGTKNDWLALNT